MITAPLPAAHMRDFPGAALWQIRRRFSVDDYYQMGETGLIGVDERTELLDGEVVFQMPINSRHAGCVNRLNRILSQHLAHRAVIAVQNPVRLDPFSEPQPDLAVLALRPDSYADAHPGAPEVRLLVEVADSSLDLDRRVKVPLYAGAGIAEVWVVDLVNASVEVYSGPDAHGYQRIARHGRGTSLVLSAFPDVAVSVDDIVGPPPTDAAPT